MNEYWNKPPAVRPHDDDDHARAMDYVRRLHMKELFGPDTSTPEERAEFLLETMELP